MISVRSSGQFVLVASIGLLLSVPSTLPAQVINPDPFGATHVVDGLFTNPNEWGARFSVTKKTFPVVGNRGGANLFVEQGATTLDLMYDYFNSGSADTIHNSPNSFFDVFFEVNNPSAKEDYLVRINAGTDQFTSFERTHGSLAPLLPDGTFDIGPGSGWMPLTPSDLQNARFHSAIGFGHDPATPGVPDHVLAEFELSINRPNTAPPVPGLYDPSPAFWSASADIPGKDPPITSGIFTLNPDGSTTVDPVFGPLGGPVKRPQDAVPEPGSIALLMSAGISGGLFAASILRRRRNRGQSMESLARTRRSRPEPRS